MRRPVFPYAAILLAIALLVLPALGSPAFADDRSSTTPTGWWVMTGQTVAQVSAFASANNARIVDLSIDQSSPTLLLTVTYVANTGSYAQTWWWYVGQSVPGISSLCTANNARLVCVKRYQVGGVDQFACIMVSNTGANAKSWWWYVGQTTAQLTALWQANNARLVHLSSYDVAGTRYYDAIMISNTGADASGWWWYVGQSQAAVSTALTNNSARLLDMETYSVGASRFFNVIMVPNTGASGIHWWWYYNQQVTDVIPVALQNGARIVDFTRYTSEADGTTRYASLMVGNVDPITTRIGDVLNWGNDGATGCYLKRVGGAQVAGLQQSLAYEPASSIKALIALHYMRQVGVGLESQGASHSVFTALTGSCPLDAAPVTESFGTSLYRMLKYSDNARTQFFRQRYGNEAINATAASVVGMTGSSLHHRLGCGDSALAQPNVLTLEDAGLLYERIFDATVLSPAGRDTLRQYLVNETDNYPIQVNLNAIVDQEAAALGMSSAAPSFKAQMRLGFKAGSYGLYPGGSPSLHYDYSISGWLQLPRCDAPPATGTQYVFGVFINNSLNQATTDSRLWSASAELFREQIRAALSGCALDAPPPATLARTLELASPWPNPSAQGATLHYTLPIASAVHLSVLDVTGREVAQLARRIEGPGEHSAAWDATASDGSHVPAGVYFVRLEAAGKSLSRKLVIEP